MLSLLVELGKVQANNSAYLPKTGAERTGATGAGRYRAIDLEKYGAKIKRALWRPLFFQLEPLHHLIQFLDLLGQLGNGILDISQNCHLALPEWHPAPHPAEVSCCRGNVGDGFPDGVAVDGLFRRRLGDPQDFCSTLLMLVTTFSMVVMVNRDLSSV